MLLLPMPAAAQWRYPPPYPAYGYARPESSLRVNVTPKQASVYVDGYFAGRVDEFDGRLQRLHVLPGEHEITIYLEGYRSMTRQLYMSPNSTRTISGALERLAPGDQPDKQPVPADRDEQGPNRVGPPNPMRRMPPARGPARQGDQDGPEVRSPRGPDESRFATLSIQVRPGGGVLQVDGERWDLPGGDERLIVQVPEGRHVIEVERQGYDVFTTEVDARRGETTPLNISLRRR